MDERLDEILERLRALEHRLDERDVRCSFAEEERRVVDLIVRLTTENVLRAVEERSGPEPPRHGPPHHEAGPPGHGSPGHQRPPRRDHRPGPQHCPHCGSGHGHRP